MSIESGTYQHQLEASLLSRLLTPVRVSAFLIGLVAVMVALWPLGLTADYFNHLARNHIEAMVWTDPDLQAFYSVSFAIIPDLTMDLIVPWLSHLTGIYTAGAVTIWMALILPPLGGLLIARHVHGHIPRIALGAFFVMFNENMQWGFVNFAASSGLALLSFALWIRCDAGWRRSFVFAPLGLLLVLNHALAFLLFGYLALLWELAAFYRGQRGTFGAFLRQLMTVDAVAMVPGLVLFALSLGGSGQLPQIDMPVFAMEAKLQSIWSALLFFNSPLARIASILLIGAVCIGLSRGILKMDFRMVWVCSGVLVLVVAMPTGLLGIWGLHHRFPAVLFILVAASLRFDREAGARIAMPGAVIAGLLMLAVIANAALQMSRLDAKADSLREVVAALPSGARVLPARHEDTDLTLAIHSAALSVIDRAAYVPNLFTNTSPVDVTLSMRDQHMPQAWPLLEGQLRKSMTLDRPKSSNGFWSRRYFFDWPSHWDYVLYFRDQESQALEFDVLCAVSLRAEFVLYKINPDGCQSNS